MLRAFGLQSRWEGLSVRGLLRRAAEPAAWLLARTGRLELVWLAFPIAELAALAMSTIFLRKTLRTAECRMADDDYGEIV